MLAIRALPGHCVILGEGLHVPQPRLPEIFHPGRVDIVAAHSILADATPHITWHVRGHDRVVVAPVDLTRPLPGV